MASTPSRKSARGPLPEYRGGRCQQTGVNDDLDGDVYVAPAFIIGTGFSTPIVTLHVVRDRGRTELSVEDARAVRDALDKALEWLA